MRSAMGEELELACHHRRSPGHSLLRPVQDPQREGRECCPRCTNFRMAGSSATPSWLMVSIGLQQVDSTIKG